MLGCGTAQPKHEAPLVPGSQTFEEAPGRVTRTASTNTRAGYQARGDFGLDFDRLLPLRVNATGGTGGHSEAQTFRPGRRLHGSTISRRILGYFAAVSFTPIS